jgi:acetyl-CoA carboxylase, biotin carboxylase subunit
MKILIANRGEIAVRVIRACHEMGATAVAVYSECDRHAFHVRAADEAYEIGPSPAADSYLRADVLVDVARRSGATLVHPGYGFLAENAAFAERCEQAGLTFIGPRSDAIRAMGGKTSARQIAVAAGVPVVPGSDAPFGDDVSDDTIMEAARRIGLPLMVKAVAGGGGKGMRTVRAADDLPAAIRLARSEARAAFGDAAIYLERRLVEPRHIEIQLLGDHHGTVVPFVERECSIQRRHQKVVEESPSPVLSVATRRAMADAAVRVARRVGYTSAGTIEFLVDADESFYFLEMNTRLQVEHPVTEAVTGLDLVQWQIRIANGEALTIDPDQAMTPRGHAIECRIYAEDADRGFVPSPGRVRGIVIPGGPFVRDDRGVEAGDDIPIFYDPLIAKLSVWGGSRDEAIERMTRAVDEYRVAGVRTTLPFFRWLMREPAFREARFSTTYLDGVLASRTEPFEIIDPIDARDAAIAVALDAWFARSQTGARAVADGSGWRRIARQEGLR